VEVDELKDIVEEETYSIQIPIILEEARVQYMPADTSEEGILKQSVAADLDGWDIEYDIPTSLEKSKDHDVVDQLLARWTNIGNDSLHAMDPDKYSINQPSRPREAMNRMDSIRELKVPGCYPREDFEESHPIERGHTI
jgi:hypothetical protein